MYLHYTVLLFGTYIFRIAMSSSWIATLCHIQYLVFCGFIPLDKFGTFSDIIQVCSQLCCLSPLFPNPNNRGEVLEF